MKSPLQEEKKKARISIAASQRVNMFVKISYFEKKKRQRLSGFVML